jgi:hypothetical protein
MKTPNAAKCIKKNMTYERARSILCLDFFYKIPSGIGKEKLPTEKEQEQIEALHLAMDSLRAMRYFKLFLQEGGFIGKK